MAAQKDSPGGAPANLAGVWPGGHRRIDRVLAPDYLSGVAQLPLEQLRALRDETDQEETDLSYLRRLLQARLDLVQAELDRRAAGEPPAADLVEHLRRVLADAEPRPAAHGLGRHRTREPSRGGEQQRYVEQLVSDDLLLRLSEQPEPALTAALRRLQQEEAATSALRTAVQGVLDALGAEIGRRYRDGQADVVSLLQPPSA